MEDQTDCGLTLGTSQKPRFCLVSVRPQNHWSGSFLHCGIFSLALIENKGSDVTRYMERISWTCKEGLRLENAWAVLSASINRCGSQDKGQTCKDIVFSLTSLKYRQMLACSVYLSDSEVEVTFSVPHVKHN